MIREASMAIETVTVSQQREQAEKYAKRNKMRYLDRLLDQLERLNLADQSEVPKPLADAVKTLVVASPPTAACNHCGDEVLATMDCLYEIQDALMGHPDDD